MSDQDRFAEDRGKYHIYELDEQHVALTGGGDFYDANPDDDTLPDEETQAEARKLAEKYGMRITGMKGEWQGWSEYTPDPGDLSIFYWEKA
jgi:hypothetical protein